MSGSSYNAVTWLLDRNVDEGRGATSSPSPTRCRELTYGELQKQTRRARQPAAPARRPPRRARGDDHARHGGFPDRVSRRHPRRHRAGAAQHAADRGSIRLCAGGLPRAGAVRFGSAAAGGQGYRRADARPRACRRRRQRRARPQETVRRNRQARATPSRPRRRMPTSRRSGCIRRARPACPRACAICMPIWPRPRRPMPSRCSASARTMSDCRRQNCSSPMASATR